MAVLDVKIVSSDTLRFDIVGHVMVVVHADMPPDPADWSRMSTVRDSSRERLRGFLVVAPPRASINASQRADVFQHSKATNASIAVVTDSALVRGLARAVGFLGVSVRAFAAAEMVGALDYLLVLPSRHAEVIQRVEALKAQLAVRPPERAVQKLR